jgi:hypothetical protein
LWNFFQKKVQNQIQEKHKKFPTMQRLDRDFSPELRGDELRALNRGDDGNLRFLGVPEKTGLTSNASSSSDFMREDTSPIFQAATRIAPVVSKKIFSYFFIFILAIFCYKTNISTCK